MKIGVATMLPRPGAIRGDSRTHKWTTIRLEAQAQRGLIARSPSPSLTLRNGPLGFESLPHRQIPSSASELGRFARSSGIARLAFGSPRLGTNPCLTAN
jgi:hypothetical protein